MAEPLAIVVLMGAFAATVWTHRDRLVGHGPFLTRGVLVYFLAAAALASLLGGGVTLVLRLVT